MPLEILIAGAGIAGASAAIGLARHGHTVKVYERRHDQDGEDETLGGVQLQPNAIHILKQLGALEEVSKVTHESHWTDVRRCTGETVLLIDMQARGGTRWGPRMDFKGALEKYAIQCGAEIHRGHQIVAVSEESDRPTAIFADGSRQSADLIVGADGTNSKVRRSMFPDFQPTTLSETIFQVVVPLDFMQEDSDTKALLRNSPAAMVHMGPGTCIVSSPSFHHNVYDMQLMDWSFPLSDDPNPELVIGRMKDLSHVKRRWAEHEPGVVKVIDKAESCWKWRLKEVRNLPRWSSEKGNILLIGDASHGIVPHAGQGAAMGIEDGALLGELLKDASPDDDTEAACKAFEAIRRPRCDLMRTFAKVQGATWTASDPKTIRKRDEGMGHHHPVEASTTPHSKAPFASPAFQMWLDHYDVEEEVRKGHGSTSAVQAKL